MRRKKKNKDPSTHLDLFVKGCDRSLGNNPHFCSLPQVLWIDRETPILGASAMKVTLDIPQSDLEKLIAPPLGEPRLLLENVSWAEYQTLLQGFGDRPGLRLSYLEGTLEIMATSPEHEAIKKNIARLIEIYALEKDIPLFSCGSATFRREATARGLEPDESYCIGTRKEMPELAIEVVITSGSIDKLEIYKGLNVREVWFWQNQRFNLYLLRGLAEGYEPISRSTWFPDLDPNLLAQYINPEREPQMVKAFRHFVCQESSGGL